MLVNLTRVDKENNMPMGLVSMLDSELDSSADVVLLLADKSVVKAHKCFLSVSPVLKEVLMSLDCRLDKMVHISMPDFNKRTVLSFIQFLYNGFVDLDRNHKELYRLFKALKVNPPVITERRPNCMENVGKVKVVEMMVDEVLTVRDECNIDNNEKQKTDVMEGDETSKLVSMSISSQDVEDQTEEKRNDADNESTNLMTSSSLSALARHTGEEESEKIRHLYERLAILLVKGNAALFLNRLPNHPNHPSPLIDGSE